MKNDIKLISIYLMGYKGYMTLNSIPASSIHLIDRVIGATDTSIQNDYYKEIKEICKEKNIPFYDRYENTVITSQYAIAISWRWIINLQDTKLIVLHDSLLPKYRGFNPLVSALLNKEEKIGVTALFASEEYDRGNIIKQSSILISYPIKIEKVIELISFEYINLVKYILLNIKNLSFYTQDETQASYSLWRDKEDYFIDWNNSSEYIKRFIDAVGYPYLGAKTLINEQDCITILEAEIIEDVFIENRQIGKVIFMNGNQPTIVCKTGLLKITKATYDQLEKEYKFDKFRSRFS